MKSNVKEINMENRFNWERFVCLWKNYFFENFWSGVCIIGLQYIVFVYLFYQGGITDMLSLGSYEYSFLMISYVLIFNSYFACFFNKMQKKNRAVFFFTLPASPAEKYWAGLSYSVVMGGVLVILPFLLWAATRMLVDWLQGMPRESLVFLTMWKDNFPAYYQFFSFGLLAWVSSVFWLCGMYFRTRSYLKVCLFYFVCLVPLFFSPMHSSFAYFLWEKLFMVPLVSYIVGTFFLLLVVFNVWLAYRLFCKKEIVKTK